MLHSSQAMGDILVKQAGWMIVAPTEPILDGYTEHLLQDRDTYANVEYVIRRARLEMTGDGIQVPRPPLSPTRDGEDRAKLATVSQFALSDSSSHKTQKQPSHPHSSSALCLSYCSSRLIDWCWRENWLEPVTGLSRLLYPGASAVKFGVFSRCGEARPGFCMPNMLERVHCAHFSSIKKGFFAFSD